MARWTDTSAFPLVNDPATVASGDRIPFASVAETAGERQRQITYDVLQRRLNLVGIVSVSANYTPDIDDVGAHIRVTAAATVTLPPGLPTGAFFTIAHQGADTDVVDLAAGSGVTIVSADDARDISHRGGVLALHIGSDTWEVYGAFAEAAS